MRKIIIAAILVSASFVSFAQDNPKSNEEETSSGGFKKENLFVGGSVDLSLSTYGTVIGLEPEFGYSVNKWLDAGIVVNFIYSSQRVYNYDGSLAYKYRQTDLGPGAFLRAYPIDFLFVQAQYENNFINSKTLDAYGNSSPSFKTSTPSLLLGAGYATGRQGGGGEPFFYLSVSFDVLAKYYSPYVAIDGGGNTIILPIVRGGIQIPLFQNNNNKGSHHRNRDNENY